MIRIRGYPFFYPHDPRAASASKGWFSFRPGRSSDSRIILMIAPSHPSD
ncbi:Uncharacterized protein dnm_068960 [Desulfonema magnum]|uniref:Uncharacterized protein n=1 Tax=Desulfonema magnum TaxID=45655 RepID=A0A975BT96_9BACT|nr:Uncharacterized protein dnm_068960 [Desulfonema magnum]